MIVMGVLVENIYPNKYAVIQWHAQAGSITTNLKLEVDFILPEISVTKIVTW